MRRPAKLADRLDPVQVPAAFDQGASIAREGRGIAGNISNALRSGRGQIRRLLLGAGARWIEHDRFEATKLLDRQRAAKQIAMLNRHLPTRMVAGDLERQRG